MDGTVSLLDSQFGIERSFTELIEPTQVAPWGLWGAPGIGSLPDFFVCQTFEGQLRLRAPTTFVNSVVVAFGFSSVMTWRVNIVSSLDCLAMNFR